jgi:hypothetical protein
VAESPPAGAVTGACRAALWQDVIAFPRLPRRTAALALMVLGQSALALLAPAVAAGPALASFVAAGVVLAR